MNSYDLSRRFWDWAFNNPHKIKPIHPAIYFFSIEHCNRLGWKKNFGFPTTMVMEATGIKSYNTYIKGLNDLVEFGFIEMIERSKNQYSANIIALSKFDKAPDKALDKALIKHDVKQSESTIQSIDSIDKQETSKQLNNKQETKVVQLFADEKLNSKFVEWVLYRKEINKSLKKTTMNAQIKKLEKYSPEVAIKMIEQSVENGWTGLFDLKENKVQQNNGKSQFQQDLEKTESAKKIALDLWNSKN